MRSFIIRPAQSEDDAAVTEIYNLQEPDGPPLTVDRLREERAEQSGGHAGEQVVAAADGAVVGYGRFHWAWWTGSPEVYALEIRAHPRYARNGIGTRLYETLRSQLVSRRAGQFLAWVRSDCVAGRSFAGRIGCSGTGQEIQDYRLAVSEAEIGPLADLNARLEQEGLRLFQLAKLEMNDITFLRALQRLWAEWSGEPKEDAELGNTFDTWRREVLEAPGLSPETHWVAMVGERPVGMTFLKRLSREAFENDYTAVALDYRRRGIATALKLQAIKWAQHNGVDWFYTSSKVDNHAMIAVNTQLGYRPGAKRLEVGCTLAS